MPKVSVVMPVFNGEKYLVESIESILAQSFKDFEFIIVNDGSSDDSNRIIENFQSNDCRIININSTRNLGISKATNTGIKRSSGNYIALMDQDDISYPDRLEKEVKFLDGNPEIFVVGGNTLRLDENGGLHGRKPVMYSPCLIRWSLLFKNVIQNPTVMMRREIFTDFNYTYEEFEPSQDYALWCKLNLKFWFSNLPDVLLISRDHRDNASKLLQEKKAKNLLKMKEDLVKTILGKVPEDRILRGLSDMKSIDNVNDAKDLMKIMIFWQRKSFKWCGVKSEKKFIAKQTSRKIRDLWYLQGRKVSLLPYIFYTIFLGG